MPLQYQCQMHTFSGLINPEQKMQKWYSLDRVMHAWMPVASPILPHAQYLEAPCICKSSISLLMHNMTYDAKPN